MNCSVIICLILAGAIIIVNGYEEALPSRHRRHSKQESNQEIEEETGNGYEFEGLKGHAGLFSGFNWTRGELAKVSVWHATAQHYKVAELVEVIFLVIKKDLCFRKNCLNLTRKKCSHAQQYALSLRIFSRPPPQRNFSTKSRFKG
jgi:hypothetical protein